MEIIPVILAGGSGSRLWPLSRSMHPKQLLPLLGKHTMLQETILRTQTISESVSPIIICNKDHQVLVKQQLEEIDMRSSLLILEPEGKNTAPAATIAALATKNYFHRDAILLLLPADHFIKNLDSFTTAVHAGRPIAQDGKLVTFGITPNQPETGYGYIKAGKMLDAHCFSVEQFVEKPDLETATNYLHSRDYYWNSGIFMFSANHFLQEMHQHAPDILAACQTVMEKTPPANNHHLSLDPISFSTCRSDSIDYAIMEKTSHAALIPLNAIWSDLGSFAALWEMHEADAQGNVTRGDVITQSVEQSYLHAESRMLAVVGVKDHVIVETADAVLVAHRSHSQAVKEIVSQLKQKQRIETVTHKKVYRQWGFYEILNEGKNYKVKRLTLVPGASISLQMHSHRSEHWVIVNGRAKVRCGEQTIELNANESTYIPCKVKHKLSNPYKEKLEVIEVQSGDYLGEDDIVRFD